MTKTKQTAPEKLKERMDTARLLNMCGGEAFRSGRAVDSISPVVCKWKRDAWTAGWKTAEREGRHNAPAQGIVQKANAYCVRCAWVGDAFHVNQGGERAAQEQLDWHRANGCPVPQDAAR